MPTKVIYHSADLDGIFCREIARKAMDQDNVVAEYIGWNYGDPLPAIAPTDDVYMLDISIDGLMGHPNLTWIDHHGTAIQKYKGGVRTTYCIDGVAACRLAWQWFFVKDGALPMDKQLFIDRRVVEPEAVRLAGEYDVWDHRDHAALLLQYGIRTLGYDKVASLVSFEKQSFQHLQDIITVGGVAHQYAKNTNASLVRGRGHLIVWEGLHWLALNTAQCNSLTFEAGVLPQHDALLAYYFNGKCWVVSLYGITNKPHDLSRIAVKYGGGGHKHACGFTCQTLPWML